MFGQELVELDKVSGSVLGVFPDQMPKGYEALAGQEKFPAALTLIKADLTKSGTKGPLGQALRAYTGMPNKKAYYESGPVESYRRRITPLPQQMEYLIVRGRTRPHSGRMLKGPQLEVLKMIIQGYIDAGLFTFLELFNDAENIERADTEKRRAMKVALTAAAEIIGTSGNHFDLLPAILWDGTIDGMLNYSTNGGTYVLDPSSSKDISKNLTVIAKSMNLSKQQLIDILQLIKGEGRGGRNPSEAQRLANELQNQLFICLCREHRAVQAFGLQTASLKSAVARSDGTVEAERLVNGHYVPLDNLECTALIQYCVGVVTAGKPFDAHDATAAVNAAATEYTRSTETVRGWRRNHFEEITVELLSRNLCPVPFFSPAKLGDKFRQASDGTWVPR